MYARLSGHPAQPPFVNLQGRQVFATVRNIRRGHLQGLSGTVPAVYQSAQWPAAAIQAQWDAAQSIAPGFLAPGSAFPSAPAGYVMIWWPSPAGQYVMFVKQGQIASMPNGGAVYSYSQAGASAASPQNPSTGFQMVPGITLNGAPAYQAVYVPPSAQQAQSAVAPVAAATPVMQAEGVIPPPSAAPVMAVQGPVQSSGGITATASLLPSPSVMDMSATDQSTAVAAAINGQGVTGTGPVPDGGPSTLTWIALGVVAFLLLRR